jgi:hypothetical protein
VKLVTKRARAIGPGEVVVLDALEDIAGELVIFDKGVRPFPRTLMIFHAVFVGALGTAVFHEGALCPMVVAMALILVMV